jgi:hypothetical protein
MCRVRIPRPHRILPQINPILRQDRGAIDTTTQEGAILLDAKDGSGF